MHDAARRERLLERAGALLQCGGPDALSLRTLAHDCDTSAYRAAALDDPLLVLDAPTATPGPFTEGVRRAVESHALRTDADPPTVALALQALLHGLVALKLRRSRRPARGAGRLAAAAGAAVEPLHAT